MSKREIIKLTPLTKQSFKTEPLSIITVHFCDDIKHNLRHSECINNPYNQVIEVDNRANLFHATLGQAINHGIDQAQNDLLVIVHEDVLLVPEWESYLFRSIAELNAANEPWGLLGSVGFTTDSLNQQSTPPLGHWSDPHQYKNTFSEDEWFTAVDRLDEQVMVMRKSSAVRLDPHLPSIHNIGRDLPLTFKSQGLKTFAINAPTIHKYADRFGNRILKAADSDKIKHRKTLPWKAEKALSDTYFCHKWRHHKIAELDAPVLLITHDQAATNYLKHLCSQLEIFLCEISSNDLNTNEFAEMLYRLLLHKLQLPLTSLHSSISKLQDTAAKTLNQQDPSAPWAIMIPGAGVLLTELIEAFPRLRLLHLLSDPATAYPFDPPLIAQLDNEIGRAVLPCAYRALDRPVVQILKDSQRLRNACTLRHQIETVLTDSAALANERVLRLKMEDFDTPAELDSQISAWLGFADARPQHAQSLHLKNLDAQTQSNQCKERVEIESILHPLRQRLGYL